MLNKISINQLKELALNLKFDMEEKEYQTLQNEFEIILKQMEMINMDFNTENVEPMSFPFEDYHTDLREDNEIIESSREDILKNAAVVVDGQIKINKVVE
ncbi:glutamyl-tRNA(Gln) amidotransferase C subunit [Firmicutes bacterium CAG:631]|nr:glutamyl-tRNA(Gln) amidotransferase C subunit [Firmicutes bacterium CAG:631]